MGYYIGCVISAEVIRINKTVTFRVFFAINWWRQRGGRYSLLYYYTSSWTCTLKGPPYVRIYETPLSATQQLDTLCTAILHSRPHRLVLDYYVPWHKTMGAFITGKPEQVLLPYDWIDESSPVSSCLVQCFVIANFVYWHPVLKSYAVHWMGKMITTWC